MITQAVPEMLEILPPTSSKGDGVRALVVHLVIDAQDCLAFCDGENDCEMFELVGRSIAVDNARPALKDEVSVVGPSTDDYGIAQVLEQILADYEAQQPRSRL